MAQREYALGALVNGLAEGWHHMPSEAEAIKQSYERSMEHSTTQCIMLGTGENDEDAQVEYLVVGGNFYKRHDL
tara:strand:+ start:3857 stop:4078 length:222 start_codon:yes stop_codon:yes gene_type:complete